MSDRVLCVPAFADGASSWRPLLDHVPAEVADLSAAEPPTVAGHAAALAGLVTNPVILIGHSLGSAIAVETAHLLGPRCRGLLSIEGNLTPEDAYFSGQAADFDDPVDFKQALLTRIGQLVAAGQVPSTYVESLAATDERRMWTLGRDARDRDFGSRYRSLACPTLYLWSATSTPRATAEYLAQHRIPARRLSVEHHWPWLTAPAVVAEALAELS